jgi:prepilin-type N-terminal cleavage/methylation domain-containing protein
MGQWDCNKVMQRTQVGDLHHIGAVMANWRLLFAHPRGHIVSLRRGFTLFEMAVAMAVLTTIAAIILSTSFVVSGSDQERYKAAGDTLYALTQAIAGNQPGRAPGLTHADSANYLSFKWVIRATPGKLSDLTTQIVATTGLTICGSGHPYTATMQSAWVNPFWHRELRTTGTMLVPGFTVQDAIVTYSGAGSTLGFHNTTSGAFQATPDGTPGNRRDATLAIRMPSVTLADAQGLDVAVDGTVDGTAGIVRYSSASDPTQVDYYFTVTAISNSGSPNDC